MKKHKGSKSSDGGGIIRHKFPKGEIRFNVEYIEQYDPVMGDMSHYSYDYAECDDITSDHRIIESIVRSRYSQDEVEAIFANHIAGADGDMSDFQQWRKVAKIVAKKKVYLKSEIDKLI